MARVTAKLPKQMPGTRLVSWCPQSNDDGGYRPLRQASAQTGRDDDPHHHAVELLIPEMRRSATLLYSGKQKWHPVPAF